MVKGGAPVKESYREFTIDASINKDTNVNNFDPHTHIDAIVEKIKDLNESARLELFKGRKSHANMKRRMRDMAFQHSDNMRAFLPPTRAERSKQIPVIVRYSGETPATEVNFKRLDAAMSRYMYGDGKAQADPILYLKETNPLAAAHGIIPSNNSVVGDDWKEQDEWAVLYGTGMEYNLDVAPIPILALSCYAVSYWDQFNKFSRGPNAVSYEENRMNRLKVLARQKIDISQVPNEEEFVTLETYLGVQSNVDSVKATFKRINEVCAPRIGAGIVMRADRIGTFLADIMKKLEI